MKNALDASRLEDCVTGGGVVLFPADTVYGLACAPDSEDAVRRLYELKGRAPDKPAAVMFFALAPALSALPELGPRTRRLLERLLPGAVTVLVPNPHERFALACGPDRRALGLRVPDLPRLREVSVPVLQSSANASGAPDARRLDDVPAAIRAGVDLVLDGEELPGTPSTVVDLRAFEESGDWRIVRSGAVPEQRIAQASRFS